MSEPDVDPKVREAVQALDDLGAQIQEVSIPAQLEAGGMVWALLAEGMSALMFGNGAGHDWKGLYNESFANALRTSLQAQAQDLTPQAKCVIMMGTYLNRTYHGRLYAKARNQRRVLQAAYDTVFEHVDLLVMPTTPTKAHRYDPDPDTYTRIVQGWNMLGNTAGFNLTGHPSLSVPCGK